MMNASLEHAGHQKTKQGRQINAPATEARGARCGTLLRPAEQALRKCHQATLTKVTAARSKEVQESGSSVSGSQDLQQSLVRQELLVQQDLIKKLQDTSNMLQQLLEYHEQEVAAMERSGQANVSWTRERLEVIDQLELKSLGLKKAMEGNSRLLKS